MVELVQYLSIARRWWWLIVLSTLLGAGVGWAVSTVTPEVYRASASLLVRSGRSTDDYGAVMASEKMALTYEALISKRPVIEEAARALGLSPDAIADRLDVELVSRTMVIEIGVRDGDPRRAAAIANAVTMAFVKTQQESGTARARDIAIVEYARVPSQPDSPNKPRALTIAAVGGLVLGVGSATLIELSNDRLRGVEEIRHSLQIPTLAVVPRARARNRKRAKARHSTNGRLPPTLWASPYSVSLSEADSHPHGTGSRRREDRVPITDPADQAPAPCPAQEAYFTLRTWLQFSYQGGPLPSLVITSPRSHRDKGDVTINLGGALARVGLRVILVDADLRKPSLHHIFEDAAAEEFERGLGELLSNGLVGASDEYVVGTGVPNLSLLPAGAPPADPLRLVNSQEMAWLLRRLRKQADVVLIVAPPVLAAADALVLAARADATVLVIEARATRYKWAAQALAMLRNAQANVLGAVLTRARVRPSDPPAHCDFGQPVERPESMSWHMGVQPQLPSWVPAPEQIWRTFDGAPHGGIPGQPERKPTETTLLALIPGQSLPGRVLRTDPYRAQEDGGNDDVRTIVSERDLHV